jgi:hypothetical protein
MELCIITLIYKVVCYLSNDLPMILKKKGVNASEQYILTPMLVQMVSSGPQSSDE